jgi:PHP family Zn ribbon phosphoesterase
MPWCEECAKYLTPTAMNDDGTCPNCGGEVGGSEQRAAEVADVETTPWHFKLLVVALVVYLGWRFVQIFI